MNVSFIKNLTNLVNEEKNHTQPANQHTSFKKTIK